MIRPRFCFDKSHLVPTNGPQPTYTTRGVQVVKYISNISENPDGIRRRISSLYFVHFCPYLMAVIGMPYYTASDTSELVRHSDPRTPELSLTKGNASSDFKVATF